MNSFLYKTSVSLRNLFEMAIFKISTALIAVVLILSTALDTFSQTVHIAGGSVQCTGTSFQIYFMGSASCPSATIAGASSWHFSVAPDTGPVASGPNGSNDYSRVTVSWNSAQNNLTVSATFHCSPSSSPDDTPTIPVTISTPVNLNVNLTAPSSVCSGSSIALTASSTNSDIISYEYFVDNSSVYTGSASSYNFSTTGLTAGNHPAKVIMKTNPGCTIPPNAMISSEQDPLHPFTFTVTPKTDLIATLHPPVGLICSGTSTAEFYVTTDPTPPNLSYVWFVNGAQQSGSSSLTVNATEGNSVSCTVSSTGCFNPDPTGSYTIHITQTPTPWVSIQIPKRDYCPGESISLTAESEFKTSSSTFKWWVNGNLLVNNANPTSVIASATPGLTVFYNGGGNIQVDAANLSGNCLTPSPASDNSSDMHLNVYPPTVASFTNSPSPTACVGSNYTYTTQAGKTGYVWTFSSGGTKTAGGTSSSNSISITWDAAGPRWVRINYTETNGCTGLLYTQHDVTVSTPPVPTIISPPTDACLNTAAAFTTQSGKTSYNWIASGATIVGQGTYNPTISWNTAGANKSVSVSYVQNGCTGLSSAVLVSVNAPKSAPQINTGGPQTVCRDSTGNVYTTQTGMSGYSWTINGGTITSSTTTSTATATWNVTGAKSISVNYSNSAGCPVLTAATMAVTVNDRLSPTINGALNVCINSAGNQYQTELSKSAYKWTAVNGTINTGQGTSTIDVTWNSINQKTLTVTYKDNNNCLSSTGSKTITIQPASSSVITVTGNARFGAGVVNLKATGAAPEETYEWYNFNFQLKDSDDEFSPSVNLPSFNNPTTNNFFYVKAFTSFHCPSPTYSVPVYVYDTPVITYTADRVYMGSSSTLSTTVPYDTYTWKKGSTTVASGQSFSTTTTGDYTVTVTKNGAAGTSGAFRLAGQFDDLSENYILTHSMLVDGVTPATSIPSLTADQVSQTVQYFDGLGRPTQTIITQGSPSGADLVQALLYDEFGREVRKFLPFAHGTDGRIKNGVFNSNNNFSGDALDFYTNAANVAHDPDRPFSETGFEPSPLNRPLKQFGPGKDWYDNNKFVSLDYKMNIDGSATNGEEKIINWTLIQDVVSGQTVDLVSQNGYWPSNSLNVHIKTDEDNRKVREYTDRIGRMIARKVQAVNNANTFDDTGWAITYYIYDDFDRPRIVLQPVFNNGIATYSAATSANKNTMLNNLSFRYTYDKRGRMITKQVPGAAVVYMVYDDRDRLVLTQDGNQRSTALKYWTFTKYDALNRPILTGIKDTAKSDGTSFSQTEMQGFVNAFYAKPWAKWSEYYIVGGTGNIHGYSNQTYPVCTGPTSTVDANRYLNVIYYDNYDFRQGWATDYNYLDQNLSEVSLGTLYNQPDFENTFVTGQVTGTKVKVLDGGVTGGSTWLKSVNYYDDRYRMIQSIADNNKSGFDRATIVYDFTGKPLKANTAHYASALGSFSTKTIIRRLQYDHSGRLLKTWHQVIVPGVTSSEILLSQNEYNELGQLVDKDLHVISSTPKQSVDYRYNIRGWLTSINNPSLTADAVNDDNNDLFGMDLDYNEGSILSLAANTDTLTMSAVSYYKLDGNGNDNGTANKAGTVTGGAVLAPDRNGVGSKAYLFNGPTQYINVSNSTITHAFIQNTGVFTISAYIKLNDLSQSSIIVANHSNISYKGFVFMFENVSGTHQLKFMSFIGDGTHQNMVTGGANTINDTNWHHVAVVGDGKFLTIYVDGATDGTATPILYFTTGAAQYNTMIANTRATNGTLTIGMHGTIDDVKIFNTSQNVNAIKGLSGRTFGGSQYSGNVSSITWSNNLGLPDIKQKQYVFSYDAMNRLTDATFQTGKTGASGLAWAVPATNSFIEGGITYDLNGNIKTLNRTNEKGGNSDQLSFDYGSGVAAGNRLIMVKDFGDRKQGFTEFADPSSSDYSYDANGNLVFDRNKSGTEITKNGDFDNAGTNWSLTGITSRVSFANSAANIAAGSSPVNFSQFVVKPGKNYVLLIDFERTSGAGNLTVTVGGTSLGAYGASGIITASVVAGATTELKVNITSTFVGKINKIELKGLVTISYNYLNLPEVVTMGDDAINYIYDASGRKLSQVVSKNAVTKKKTDYAGEFFYENDTLKLINHEEGRVVTTGSSAEYQYDLKDHLGNIRMTFTTKQDVETIKATFESANQISESQKFDSYPSGAQINNLTVNANSGTSSQLLNGGYNGQVGVSKSYSVMPGDVVGIKAYAKYSTPSESPGNLVGFATSLLNAFSLPAPAPGEIGTASSGINDWGVLEAGGFADGSHNTDPKVFVTILIFDREHNLLDISYQQSSSSGALMTASYTIAEPGYAYIYISNEHPTLLDVYFDDVEISHTPSPVVQMQDYYPFGLTFNAYQRENAVDQNFLYNGKELQDELNLGWMDYGARMYDPSIARWMVVDPMSEKAFGWTPYRYAFDNPMKFTDPNGMFEYSDGYGTHDSKNETGSVEHSGTFTGGAKDFAAGSSARTTVVAHNEGGTRSAVVPNGYGTSGSQSGNAQQAGSVNPRDPIIVHIMNKIERYTTVKSWKTINSDSRGIILYRVPVYKVVVTGQTDDGKRVMRTFMAIRFGVQQNTSGQPFVQGIVEGAYPLSASTYMGFSYHIDGATKNDGAYMHAGTADLSFGRDSFIKCVGISGPGEWTAFKSQMADLGFGSVPAIIIFNAAPIPDLLDSGSRWNP
jgi:RHS repeat-associated protein